MRIGMLPIITLLLSMPLVWAGQPESPPGQAMKLDAPSNVSCAKSGDHVTVTWDTNPNAAVYRVMVQAADGNEVMEPVPAPPYSTPLAELTDNPASEVKAQVRAMAAEKGGKGASQPSDSVVCQGGAPAQLPAAR